MRTDSKGAWGRKGKKLQAKIRVREILCRMVKKTPNKEWSKQHSNFINSMYKK